MKNIHYIVGSGNRCLCGIYEGEPIGCRDIAMALGDLQDDFAEYHHDSCLLIAKIFKSLEEDCK